MRRETRFLTVGYRGADIRTFPVSQPGDFPLGLGSFVGVPMSTKIDNIDWATRPGVKSIEPQIAKAVDFL